MDMRQKLLIGSGIIILILFASFFLQPQPEILENSLGRSYQSLSRKEAVLNYQVDDLFIISDQKNNSLSIFQIIGFPSGKVDYKTLKKTLYDYPDATDFTKDFMRDNFLHWNFEKDLPPESKKLDTLRNQSYTNRKDLFKNAVEFEGRRYLTKSEQRSDWFTKLDDTALIFILLSIIPFFLMMIHDLIHYLLNSKIFSKKYQLIQCIFLILTLLFFYNMVTPVSYAASKTSPFIKYSLTLFSIFFIYQYLLKDILKDEKAYKKAIILFALSIVCLVLSNWIARLIDVYMFNSDGYTLLAERPIYFELGFLFAFALGNFLNNLRKSYFKFKRQSKELDTTKDLALASQAELNTIQASVNPHFLYNSLNAIASLAKSDPSKTEDMAFALSKFYKYQTNRSSEPLATISNELEMVDNYLAIEKIRFGDRLIYTLDIDNKSMHKRIPYFMLQPILENAIKYGYNPESEKINIKLSIQTDHNQLTIKVYDQGSHFTEKLDSGYGLKSVMKKLQLLYPQAHSIDFINEPEKHVSITIQENKPTNE